jgi:hypothetical protein
MKRNLYILLTLISFFSYSQEKTQTISYQDLIKIEPTEVYSSVIFIFDFEPAKEISYDLVYDSKTMNGSTINKGKGKMVKKVDFSELKKGMYYINFYIEKRNVKQLTFNKL